MKSYLLIIAVVVSSVGMWSSCKVPPGRGGKNTVQGTVYFNLTDHNGKFLAKEKAVDVDVFITYGDNTIYDDDTETDQDGNYIFRYMNKGSYTIHTYQDCYTCDSDKGRVEVTVDIEGKKEEVIAPDIELVEDVDPDDGYATITGKVIIKEYNVLNQQIAEYNGQDVEVYIVYDTDSTYFENIDTNGDGLFTFTSLIPGNYTVYAFSECFNCNAGTEVKKITGTIAQAQQTVTLADLIIEER